MTQFYSRNDVKYNGDVYSIPFPYMKEEEIHVYLDDVLVTDWFFLNDSQIRLRSLPEEVTSDTVVSVRRVTNIDDKVVTYTNNTLLNKENLNLSQDQLLHAVQEIYDNNEVFKQGTNEILIDNKQEILNLQSEFEDEVNTKIEMVSSAAEKINQLEDAVDTAVTAANTASQKADDIEQFVTKTEQSFNTNIQDAISESQALLQEAGEALNETKQKVEEVGGMLSLEIGDIGIAPLGIDETKGKRRYLNGQLIIQDQYIQFTNKVKSAVALYPSLACTESEWQTTATMTVGGQVGKFVVDDNAGTIRLPKIIMPIQGLTDLSKLGEIVEAGLPNIEGNLGQLPTGAGYDENTNGSFYFVTSHIHTLTRTHTLSLSFFIEQCESRSFLMNLYPYSARRKNTLFIVKKYFNFFQLLTLIFTFYIKVENKYEILKGTQPHIMHLFPPVLIY